LPIPADDTPRVSYTYKPSLIGSACYFELTEEGLSWRFSGRSGVWPYGAITAIRLSYRPVSMQARRFRADIRNANGQALAVISTTWQTAALMTPQNQSYRVFVTHLHNRIARAGGRPMLVGGLTRPVYGLGVVAMVFVCLALTGLLIRAVAIGSASAIVFLVGFAALFGWQIGGFMRRNRPRPYASNAIPADLIP
jgi:hypothetical protein